MWYEILPSFGIIMVAMALPHYGSYVINKLAFGNGYRRGMVTVTERMNYIRDRRLVNNPYKIAGLENLPPK